MEKVITLNLIGKLESGVQVILELDNAQHEPLLRQECHLSSNSQLATSLQIWQQQYRSLGLSHRIKPKGIHSGKIQQSIKVCRQLGEDLEERLQDWLDESEFATLDRRLRTTLAQNDPIRVLIRADDPRLRSLPWHQWELFKDYPQAEYAFVGATIESDRPQSPPQKPPRRKRVNILVILGDSTDIDTQKDRQEFGQLKQVGAQVKFLVEPQRQEISDHLWEQPWDVIFFAGHSQTEGNQGRIFLNAEDSLTLSELKYGLKKAIANGLQLAIFNSCDGSGLAQELEALQIPQLILMREPVPDQIAQAFLKYFLNAYTRGASLYLAMREARERLHSLEDQFPCASWLPVIYQNSPKSPPTWQTFRTGGRISGDQWRKLRLVEFPPTHLTRLAILRFSAMISFGIMGLRWLGVLFPLELLAYDDMLRRRPAEPLDPRILMVAATNVELETYGYPLPDQVLADAIEILEQHEPRAIGLNMHRAQERPPGRTALVQQFNQNQNLITVCAFDDDDQRLYGTPPEFSDAQLRNQVGFSDLELDRDNSIRRQLISYDPSYSLNPSPYCTTPRSFHLQLVHQYLGQSGLDVLEFTPNREGWQLGETTVPPLPSTFGGYQGRQSFVSNQIMINYRTSDNGLPASQITLEDVLRGEFNPSLVTDRIIIIGTVTSSGVLVETPHGLMPAVWVHAHIVSQLLSAAEGSHSLIWALPQWGNFQWGDWLWVFLWTTGSGFVLINSRRLWILAIKFLILVFILYSTCFTILIYGGWMPFVPTLTVILATATGVTYLALKKYNTGNNTESIFHV